MNSIVFQPLADCHFPLLLKWLESSHVKEWWESDMIWNAELIHKKYSRYISSNHSLNKPIYSFIILCDEIPIGYIQYYNKHDFLHTLANVDLPRNCAGLDWYIGEHDYINQGLGPKILDIFLMRTIFSHFSAVLVDPETRNINAIKAYQKAGFTIFKATQNHTWMLRLVSDHIQSLYSHK